MPFGVLLLLPTALTELGCYVNGRSPMPFGVLLLLPIQRLGEDYYIAFSLQCLSAFCSCCPNWQFSIGLSWEKSPMPFGVLLLLPGTANREDHRDRTESPMPFGVLLLLP